MLNFTYQNKKEGCLSNMSPHPVKINGKDFSMGEAAFHYMKYKLASTTPGIGATRKKALEDHADQFLITGLTGPQYKSLGGKSKNGFALLQVELAIWSNSCDTVQLDICKYKYDTYKEVRDVLHQTMGIVLIHSCRTADSKMNGEHWCGRGSFNDEGKVVVIGDNMLGNIWMSLRDKPQ